MFMTVHHHDSSSEASGAAAWMMAMVFTVVLAVALIVALFVWAPWDDDSVGGTDTGTEEQGGSDVDIEGDIDVNDGTGNEPAPSP